VEGRWSGPRSSEVGEVGGFGLLNLTLLYPNDKRGLEASFSVYNVFDRKYSDPVAFEPALPTRSAIEQDGRSVRFMLQYRF
jgi:iron complex outermembrane receptor protein